MLRLSKQAIWLDFRENLDYAPGCLRLLVDWNSERNKLLQLNGDKFIAVEWLSQATSLFSSSCSSTTTCFRKYFSLENQTQHETK